MGSVWSLSPSPLTGDESTGRYGINTPEGRCAPVIVAAGSRKKVSRVSLDAVSYVRRRAVREE